MRTSYDQTKTASLMLTLSHEKRGINEAGFPGSDLEWEPSSMTARDIRMLKKRLERN